jgi:hypothetical protein
MRLFASLGLRVLFSITGLAFVGLNDPQAQTATEDAGRPPAKPPVNRSTNQGVCLEARALAQKIRDFHDDRQWELDKNIDEARHLSGRAASEQEKNRIGRGQYEFFLQWMKRRDADFTNNYVPKAKSILRDLLSRLPPQPQKELEVDRVLFGSTAGANAIRFTAHRLDAWARKLCPKS